MESKEMTFDQIIAEACPVTHAETLKQIGQDIKK